MLRDEKQSIAFSFKMFVSLKYMRNKIQEIEWTQEGLFLMSGDKRSFKIQKSKGINKNQEKA